MTTRAGAKRPTMRLMMQMMMTTMLMLGVGFLNGK
jgi:hypothetical protein